MAWKILIPDHQLSKTDIELEVFPEDTELVSPQAKRAIDVSRQQWEEADALLLWHEVCVDASTLEWLTRCQVIVRVGVGIDNVDCEAAGRKGILVCNVPDYGTNEVADHALALMLSLARNIPTCSQAIQDGLWSWKSAAENRRLTGATLGIIGLGRIGSALALRARALGMHVVFYDPYKEHGYDKVLGVARVEDLGQIANQSDFISLHVPLTEETDKFINAQFLDQVKKGVILINTSRGKVVDLEALTAALRRGQVFSAGLDVLPEEPPDPENELIQAWCENQAWIAGRFILTPHCAFYSPEALRELRLKAAAEALRVLKGQPALNCVNREALARQDASSPKS